MWDASACAHQDATADAVHPDLRPQLVGGAGKLAGRARDVQAQDVSHRRSELPVAPAAERAEPEPYTRDAARSGERSCAALEAEERAFAPQSERLAERSQKRLEAPLQKAEPPGEEEPDVPAPAQRARMMPEVRPPDAPEQPALPEVPSPKLWEESPRALRREAQPSSGGPHRLAAPLQPFLPEPESASLAALLGATLQAALQPPCAA